VSGRTCSACSDARRPELDALIVSGASLRDIAGRFGTSKSALARHRPHVGKALVRAAERKGERREESLLEKVTRLEADARRLGETAEKEGDIRAALAAIRELLDVVKLMRELTPAPTAGAIRDAAERMALREGIDPNRLLELAERIARDSAEEVLIELRLPPPLRPAACGPPPAFPTTTVTPAAPPPPSREEPAPVAAPAESKPWRLSL